MKSSSRTAVITITTFIALTVGSASVSHGRTLAKTWAVSLKKAETLVISKKYGQARRITSRVVDEMVDVMGPGEKAAHALGMALSLRGLAEAGIGNIEDALWYWHVSLNIHPGLKNLDLSLFGEPGELLAANTLPEETHCSPCLHQGHHDLVSAPGPAAGEVIPPVVHKNANLRYPFAAIHFQVHGAVVVQVVVGRNGTISHPRVLGGHTAPTLVYTTLETIRGWSFEPARLDGVPVNVYYNLIVNYE
jgi:TonB family protein